MIQDKTVEVQRINWECCHEQGITLDVLRLDKIHESLNGNKWWKLKYNIERALQKNLSITTFGGAYSNHIVAVAAAGKLFNVKTYGIIRGEEVDLSNPTLLQATEAGMEIMRISRKDYRDKNSLEYRERLQESIGETYFIPEGGTNDLALKGTREINELVDPIATGINNYLFMACGTGGTIAGIIKGNQKNKNIIGVSVLKGNWMADHIQSLLGEEIGNWQILNEYHCGGYAKYNDELVEFINDNWKNFNLPLDLIYTSKALLAIKKMIRKKLIPAGSKIFFLHTGGLQGNRGFNQRFNLSLPTTS